MCVTFSESLFEEFCKENGIQCRRLVAREVVPTPDYEITLPDGRSVVCEVKELTPNPDDAAELRELSKGKASGRWVPPRLLKVIDSRQLQEAANAGRPTILVVYDHTPFKAYTDHMDVLQAMFGRYSITVSIDDAGETVASEPFFGEQAKMTAGTNTRISALAILDGGPVQRPLSLRVYHNPYARVRLEQPLVTTEAVRHYSAPT